MVSEPAGNGDTSREDVKEQNKLLKEIIELQKETIDTITTSGVPVVNVSVDADGIVKKSVTDVSARMGRNML